MERQHMRRRVYPGADVVCDYVVTSMRFKPFASGESFRTLDVATLAEYESGCHVHAACHGHMCRAPSGCILLPQSMSMRSMDIATQYHEASKQAFSKDTRGYIDALKQTNLTKDGTYRVVMSTPVSGSMRLLAVPQWEAGRGSLCVSRNLASKVKICKKTYDAD
ncbi:hypothetical protein F5883DRAFT_692812, partial [Diaporthe sp. PMI_573]